jgi:hypothetical protein
MRLDAERQVAEHLRTEPVTQADIFESNQTRHPRVAPLDVPWTSWRAALRRQIGIFRAFTAISRHRQPTAGES